MARVKKQKPTIDPKYPTNGNIHILRCNLDSFCRFSDASLVFREMLAVAVVVAAGIGNDVVDKGLQPKGFDEVDLGSRRDFVGIISASKRMLSKVRKSVV